MIIRTLRHVHMAMVAERAAHMGVLAEQLMVHKEPRPQAPSRSWPVVHPANAGPLNMFASPEWGMVHFSASMSQTCYTRASWNAPRTHNFIMHSIRTRFPQHGDTWGRSSVAMIEPRAGSQGFP